MLRTMKWQQVLFRQTDLSGNAKLVAAVLATMFNNNTGAWRVGLRKLEKLTSRNRGVIKRAVDELEQAGWIRREIGNPRRPTEYHRTEPPNIDIDKPARKPDWQQGW
jgi:DNA-binding MarR family transcriptional regulator